MGVAFATWRARRAPGLAFALDSAATWLLPALLIGACLGVSAYFGPGRTAASQWLDFAQTNRLAQSQLQALGVRMGGGALLVLALHAAVLWASSIHTGAVRIVASTRLNRGLAWVLALPFALVLHAGGLEEDHPFLTLLFAVISAMLVAVSAFEIARLSVRVPARVRTHGGAVALILVVSMATWWSVRIVELQIAQMEALRIGAYDLGIYLNVVWQTLEGNFLGCSFLRGETHTSAHFDPVLALIAPSLLVHRGAETLYVVQATWLASGAIPVLLLARHRCGAAFGVSLAAVYLGHPALHGVTLYDFHSLSLSVPLFLWAVWAIERRRWLVYALAVALLLSCREDLTVAAGCIGLYAAVVHRELRAGLLTIVIAVAYLFVVKRYFMTDASLITASSPEAYGYRSVFRALDPHGIGAPGLLVSVVGNLPFVVQNTLIEERALYILQLLAPLLFLPLLAGRRWVLMGYGLLFVLFASRPPVYTIGYHYAAAILPALFAVTPAIAERLVERLHAERGVPRRRTRTFLAVGMLVATLGTSVAFGAFVPNERFQAGFFPLVYEPSEEDRRTLRWLRWATREMPADAPVSASARLLPLFAARTRIYHMPNFSESDWVVTHIIGRRGQTDVGLSDVRRHPETWERIGEHLDVAVYRRRRPLEPSP